MDAPRIPIPVLGPCAACTFYIQRYEGTTPVCMRYPTIVYTSALDTCGEFVSNKKASSDDEASVTA